MQSYRSPYPSLLAPAIAVLLIALAASPRAAAQPVEADAPDTSADAVESRLERTEPDGTDADAMRDELEGYARRPIDLNTTTSDALARLPEITPRMAQIILAFVDSTAPTDIRELDSIAGLTAGQMLSLRSFTTLRARRLARAARGPTGALRMRVATDLQPRRGYRDRLYRIVPHRLAATGDSVAFDTVAIGSPYLGSRLALAARVTAAWELGELGVTFDKDAGEPLLWRDTMDYTYARNERADPAIPPRDVRLRLGGFIGGHATIRLPPVAIHLGDYTAEFGQGLVLGIPFSRSAAGDPTGAPYTPARGLVAHTSSGETGFFRGGAVTLAAAPWLPRGLTASIFASSRMLDATLNLAGDGSGAVTVGAVREDGYRRTHAELRSSGNLAERLAGANVRYGFRGGAIGITAYRAHYGAAFAGDEPGEFSGDNVTMAGIDGHYGSWWGTVFGEAARATDGSIGAIGGIASSMGGMEITLAGRWLPAGFHSPHGAGFAGAPGGASNERGIYIGATARPAWDLQLGAYVDLHDSPDRTATLSFPRAGADGLLRLEYTPVRNFELSARLRRETDRDQITVADSLNRDRRRLAERRATSGRIDAVLGSGGGFAEIRGRFERRFVDYEFGVPARNGSLTFVDVRIRPLRWLMLGARLAIFATGGFDAAIHEFEQELPGRPANVALSGDGRRFYLYAHWHPSSAITLSAKYAETVYAEGTVISPGDLQEIAGPVNNSLAVEVDVKW